MGFTSKNGLFELVTKLTPSEKRYLRQSINRLGEAKGNHAKLFEAMAKQTVYDEEKLRKKFKGTSIDKQWSRVKNYLYNYILKILQNYYQQDGEFEIYNNLQQVSILYRKGIYEEAYRLLMKTKTAAFEGIFPTLLPLIAEWEMRLNSTLYYEMSEQESVNDDENNQWAVEVASNALRYYYYQKKIFDNKFKSRYLDMEAANRELLKSAIYTSSDDAKSFYAKQIFYASKAMLYGQVGQFKAAYEESKQTLELHKKAPLLKKQAPWGYLTTINSLIASVAEIKAWEELSNIIEEIDLFISKNKEPMINIVLTMLKYIAYLKKCIGTASYKSGLAYKAAIEAFIAKHQKVPKKYVQAHLLWHYLTHICIVNGAYQDALVMIEKLEKIQRMPIFVNAILLLKLICLFELNEVLLLPYAIRSVYRSLLRKKNIYEFERIILNLLKAGINTTSKADLQLVFERYWIKLKTFSQTAPMAELELLEHFNYVAWIESKVKGIPLLNVLKNNLEVNKGSHDQVKNSSQER